MTMFGNEWLLILAFVGGLVVGCTATAWCVRFGIRSGYAVRNNLPETPKTVSPVADDAEDEFKMLKSRGQE